MNICTYEGLFFLYIGIFIGVRFAAYFRPCFYMCSLFKVFRMAALPNIDKVKKEYEEQLKKYQLVEKEREKIISQRQQLEAQKTENELVKQVWILFL